MYHDVVEPGQWDSSGFSGNAAALYKLERPEFEKHLDAIHSPALLTFDDGGSSAHSIIAPLLERRGWRGYFFITTDRIDEPGFLTATQIADLGRRGHTIGSHSCSHPPRMSACPPDRMAAEWKDSVEKLQAILGAPVTTASVPGGYYSRAVAEAAAAAGLRTLFTSEPTTRAAEIGGCRILGRYFVQRGMRPEISGEFAALRRWPRYHQALVWKLKKVAKALGGEAYLSFRERALRR